MNHEDGKLDPIDEPDTDTPSPPIDEPDETYFGDEYRPDRRWSFILPNKTYSLSQYDTDSSDEYVDHDRAPDETDGKLVDDNSDEDDTDDGDYDDDDDDDYEDLLDTAITDYDDDEAEADDRRIVILAQTAEVLRKRLISELEHTPITSSIRRTRPLTVRPPLTRRTFSRKAIIRNLISSIERMRHLFASPRPPMVRYKRPKKATILESVYDDPDFTHRKTYLFDDFTSLSRHKRSPKKSSTSASASAASGRTSSMSKPKPKTGLHRKTSVSGGRRRRNNKHQKEKMSSDGQRAAPAERRKNLKRTRFEETTTIETTDRRIRAQLLAAQDNGTTEYDEKRSNDFDAADNDLGIFLQMLLYIS